MYIILTLLLNVLPSLKKHSIIIIFIIIVSSSSSSSSSSSRSSSVLSKCKNGFDFSMDQSKSLKKH